MSAPKAKEISCRITRTILMYVRESNGGSLGPLLDGLEHDETYLSDMNNWVSHAFLQTLYERMIAILDDPDAVYKMCLASDRFHSLGFLDRVVRLLGNPKIIYSQAHKYNRLLKLNGDFFVRETGPSWMVMEDCYHDGNQKTRHDCDYTRGVLTGIPTLFGLPPAQIEELRCQVRPEKYGTRIWPDSPTYGAQGCLYRVHFGTAARPALWHRLMGRSGVYEQAIEDLLDANRTIQEKYNQVIQLAADLDSANKQLLESKQQIEQSKAELETSERRYRILAENVSDIIWTLDLATMRFDYVSPSVEKVQGYTAEEIIKKEMGQTISADGLNRALLILEAELSREHQPGSDPNRYRTIEVDLLCKDGTSVPTEVRMTFIRDEMGKPVGVLGVTRDIRARKAAQAALSAEKERLAVTLRSIGDGVITTDRDGAITLINPVAERLTGWSEAEALGKPLKEVFQLIDSRDRRPIEEPVPAAPDSGMAGNAVMDCHLIGRHGAENLISHSGAPILDGDNQIIGQVVVFRNITEHRRTEKEMQKVEKLESLGMLAGGIAHDFNNFLSGIIGNLSLIKMDVLPGERVYRRLQEMEKAALRAKALTQQLLTFAKGGDPIKRTAELTKLIQEAAQFAARGSNVLCTFDFKDGELFADIDEGQIVQVIHNLILNAVQAMPEGGTIQVRAESTLITPESRVALKPGTYALLTIQDHGIGIKAQHIKKIFDPYFTTKQKGSGLGLAVAYSVIDKHDGQITVESQIGVGTTFHIYLPSVSSSDDPMIDDAPDIETGSGRILVMDDEDFIRELAEEMLVTVGYEVGSAKNGEEAIALYQAEMTAGRPFDVVILDLTVPGGMGGQEAMKHLLATDPQVKAIVSSGDSNDPIMANFKSYGFQGAVQKPYRVQDLVAVLNSVLKKA